MSYQLLPLSYTRTLKLERAEGFEPSFPRWQRGTLASVLCPQNLLYIAHLARAIYSTPMATFERNCNFCNKIYPAKQKYINRNQGQFCSRQCAGSAAHYPHPPMSLMCAYCRKAFDRRRTRRSKSGLRFCSRVCKDTAQAIDSGFSQIHPPHFDTGKSAYRRRAIKHYGAKCVGCGYDRSEFALQVHHLDRDTDNGNLSNLRVLCRNCHAEVHLAGRILVEAWEVESHDRDLARIAR